MDTLGIKSNQATAVVQGYGNVGSVTCESLVKYDVKVIGISDVSRRAL